MEYRKITINDKFYPQKLIDIKNPPQQLFIAGNIDLLNENSIAVIGSRDCSNYGKEITKKIVTELALRNICIVSGMAIGIDSIAHISALDVCGKTVAVLRKWI